MDQRGRSHVGIMLIDFLFWFPRLPPSKLGKILLVKILIVMIIIKNDNNINNNISNNDSNDDDIRLFFEELDLQYVVFFISSATPHSTHKKHSFFSPSCPITYGGNCSSLEMHLLF